MNLWPLFCWTPQPFPSLLLVSLFARPPFLSIPTCEFVVSFQHTSFSAPVNRTRPLGFFVASVQSEEFWLTSSRSSQEVIFEASHLERRSGRDDAVLLLHKLLTGGLDGDGKTELGGVLG